MTVRKVLLYITLAVLVLVAGRVLVIFLPPTVGLWFWRVLLVPYVLVGGLIALVILLLTVFLLGKIRYSIDASIGEEKTANIEVTYLMRLVHFVLTYSGGKLDNRVRIAWLKPGADTDKPAKKKRKSAGPTATGDATIAAADLTTDEIVKGADKAAKKTAKATVDVAEDATGDKGTATEKKDRFKTLKQVKAVLTYPERKIIMALVFKSLQKFFKALKPKHLDIYGVVGFDDPATTGWAMGAYETAVGLLQLRHKIRLWGSYHEKRLELTIQARGRTRVWGLIWPFIWLYLHKPIRVVIHKHIL